jgi:hypothetical protein
VVLPILRDGEGVCPRCRWPALGHALTIRPDQYNTGTYPCLPD